MGRIILPRLRRILRIGDAAPLAAPAILVGRARMADAQNPMAFGFRMGAGVAGTVNRTHPASIEAGLNDVTNPVLEFGMPVMVNASANSLRALLTSDTSFTQVYGVSVRPYPFQQSSASNYGATTFGGEAPPPGAIDALRLGYILVKQRDFATVAAAKGGTVYVWIAAASGAHVVGGFEAASGGGSTIALPVTTTWNGPADANGVAEIAFNI